MDKSMKRKKPLCRLMAMLMCLAMIFIAGCGQTGADGTDESAGNKKSEENTKKADNKDKAMGRYLEASCGMEQSLPEWANAYNLTKMEDGSLAVFDYNEGNLFTSKDEGMTWEPKKIDWYEEFRGKVYIMDVAVSPDGNMCILHNEYDEKENETETVGEETLEGTVEAEEADEVETAEESVGEDEAEDLSTHDFTLHPVCLIFSPDGTRKEVNLEYSADGYLERTQFASDGRLFGSALDGKIYEINIEDGSCTLITQFPSWGGNMTISGNRLAAVHGEGISIVDIDNGEIIEDKVLDEFVEKTLGKRIDFNMAGGTPVSLTLQEDGSLYMVCEKGIFRYTIGGNVVEQIVDGALTTLNNPAYGIYGSVVEEDGSFYILYTGNKLTHYTYNPDIPTVPDVQLKAYSLTDNMTMKLAISLYQEKHPEVFVKYEVGMEGESSVTREDALKKLNTEIVAGTGPDLIILDDMPLDSYVQKGILKDLSPYIDELVKNETLLPNIVEAFRTEKGLFAVPVQFALPLIVGNGTDVEQVSDLETLTKTVENIRKDKAQGAVIGVMAEDTLINRLIPVCAPAWKSKDNKIKIDVLAEFFSMAKRIWEADHIGITPEIQEEYDKYLEGWAVSGATDAQAREYVLSLSGQTFQYLLGKQDFAMGIISNDFDFSTVISTFRVKGFEEGNFSVYGGQAQYVFIPNTIMGISAASRNAEQVAELIKLMLSGEGMFYSESYPINKSAFQNIFVNRYTDSDDLGSMAVSGMDGETRVLDIKWPNEEEIAKLTEYAEKAVTPYIRDAVLEDAVCEVGMKVLSGKMGAEEGVVEVEKKTAIYMSE